MSIAWEQVEGSGIHATAGVSSQMYLTNEEHLIFAKTNKSEWTQIGGNLKQISCGGMFSEIVVGVNADDLIFRLDNVKGAGLAECETLMGADGAGWVQLGGNLKHVSVGASGCVWGVNADDDIFFSASAFETNWEQVDGKLMQVCCDPLTNHVVGVNADHLIFRRTGVTSENLMGEGWEQIGGNLKYVSSCGNSLMGSNADDNLFFMRAGKEEEGWVQVPGQLTQVDLSPNGMAVGCNVDKFIFKGYIV